MSDKWLVCEECEEEIIEGQEEIVDGDVTLCPDCYNKLKYECELDCNEIEA